MGESLKLARKEERSTQGHLEHLTTYNYDEQGNLVQVGIYDFSWDEATAEIFVYLYDDQNRVTQRIRKIGEDEKIREFEFISYFKETDLPARLIRGELIDNYEQYGWHFVRELYDPKGLPKERFSLFYSLEGREEMPGGDLHTLADFFWNHSSPGGALSMSGNMITLEIGFCKNPIIQMI